MQEHNFLSILLTNLRDPRHRRILLSFSSAGALSFVLLWWASRRAGSTLGGVKCCFASKNLGPENEYGDPSKQLQYTVGVNSRFYSQLTKLAPILVPGTWLHPILHRMEQPRGDAVNFADNHFGCQDMVRHLVFIVQWNRCPFRCQSG